MTAGVHTNCGQPACDVSGEAYAFVVPGTEIPTGGACRFCGDKADLIEGDGEKVVCRDHVRILGKIVTHPDSITEEYLADLIEAHGDVVTLQRLINGARRWAWTSGWPGREPKEKT